MVSLTDERYNMIVDRLVSIERKMDSLEYRFNERLKGIWLKRMGEQDSHIFKLKEDIANLKHFSGVEFE